MENHTDAALRSRPPYSGDWSFDRIEWWINAIYHVVGFPLPCSHSGNLPELDRSRAYKLLDDIIAAYSSQIRQLSVSPEAYCSAREVQPAEALFAIKALKKWRIADPSLARERSEAALRGFLDRNDAIQAHPFGDLTSDEIYVTRQILNRWLPVPSIDDRGPGRFGPGACFEHWSHPRRFTALGKWCQQEHWPEFPVGCTDFDRSVARLQSVPKDYTKDRLITVEPAYGTFVQQWSRDNILRSIHSGPLRGSVMDLQVKPGKPLLERLWDRAYLAQSYDDGRSAILDRQELQRRKALEASRPGSGMATIDLKEASDRIGWDLVRAVMPEWVCFDMDLTRSTQIAATIQGVYFEHTLNIFAGMGNATTFPVETVTFSAIAAALARIHGIKHPRISCFGDDLICSSALARVLADRKAYCLTVGEDKSFGIDEQDCLREACGIFALNGEDITVPRIDGYTNSWSGRLGLCDVVDRLTRMKDPRFHLLARHIIETARRESGMVNLPFRIEGYPSFHYEGADFDTNPTGIRRNRDYQTLEVKVAAWKPNAVSYETTSKFPGDPFVEGLYQGWFLSQVSTSGASGPGARPGQKGVTRVTFPVPGGRFRPTWARLTPIA